MYYRTSAVQHLDWLDGFSPDFELIRAKADIRTVQELPGHANVETTIIYTHI